VLQRVPDEADQDLLEEITIRHRRPGRRRLETDARRRRQGRHQLLDTLQQQRQLHRLGARGDLARPETGQRQQRSGQPSERTVSCWTSRRKSSFVLGSSLAPGQEVLDRDRDGLRAASAARARRSR
jgi:hypothetical protein